MEIDGVDLAAPLIGHGANPETSRENTPSRELKDAKEVATAYQFENKVEGSRSDLKNYMLAFLVSLGTGMLGFAVKAIIHYLTKTKFDAVWYLIGEHREWEAYLTLVGFTTGYVVVATSTVVLGTKLAAGSGIPEIKTFLNGVNLPGILSLRTLFFKTSGLMFSVSAGLPIGLEGPLIHGGAMIASLISQNARRLLHTDGLFHNDQHWHDFVTCGAAAGLAAAFNAPIGGTLFALEEGTTHWNPKLTLTTFFCAVVTVIVMHLLLSLDSNLMAKGIEPGQIGGTGATFGFGGFNQNDFTPKYSGWLLPVFVVMGAVGGVMGATFNTVNRRLTIWRKKNVHCTTLRRVAEVLLLTFVVTTLAFTLSYTGSCRDRDLVSVNGVTQQDMMDHLRPFVGDTGYGCNGTTQYNDMASLFLVDSDYAIEILVHIDSQNDHDPLSVRTIAIFFVVFTTLACITYGVAIPSGLFIPSLLAGAAYGRLCYRLLKWMTGDSWYFDDDSFDSSAALFVLVGAASMLGGFARMTISLAVIVVELAGTLFWLPPVSVALFTAKWVGDLFNEGLYDIHIGLNGWPLLENTLPEACQGLTAQDVASPASHLITMQPVMRVHEVIHILRICNHHGFPMLETSPVCTGAKKCAKCLAGLAMRSYVEAALFLGDYHIDRPVPFTRTPRLNAQEPLSCTTCLNYPEMSFKGSDTFRTDMDHENCQVEDLKERLTPEQLDMWMDISPYVNLSPCIVSGASAASAAYRQFTRGGARHVIVVGFDSHVTGMIVRHDLMPARLQAVAEVKKNSLARLASTHHHDNDGCVIRDTRHPGFNWRRDTNRRNIIGP